MAFRFLGPDPVETQVEDLLQRLDAGAVPADIEVSQVDFKEEPGRRGIGGAVLPGSTENPVAAEYLAEELACMANTPGGGAVVLGVADDGQVIGTELDGDWLRHRIFELTGKSLAVVIRPVDFRGTRLLVLTAPQAVEPIRHQGRIRWRVGKNCEEVDAASWHSGMLDHQRFDWSASTSGHRIEDVDGEALAAARRYLRTAGDETSLELAAATDADLLRRLHLVDGAGSLTNAGSLLFVGTPEDGIDYIRRDLPGGDSVVRFRGSGPLLLQIDAVDKATQAANRIIHLPDGFVHGQLRAVPQRAAREAIVNGVVHRDWASPHPTVVEHVGDVLAVTSPGGFIGGVNPTNIITHPAVPRYRSLAETVAKLRLAEREGIGVDRMVGDLLAVGLPEPEISEMAGPYVRVGLIGGQPDQELMAFLQRAEPPLRDDLDGLLLLSRLTEHGWVDAQRAMPVLQRPLMEADHSLRRVVATRVDGSPMLIPIQGVPAGQPIAYCLSPKARSMLAHRMGSLATEPGRSKMILDWASARGRLANAEVRTLTSLSQPRVNTLLGRLEDQGLLKAGREKRGGPGFFYVPVDH